MLLRTLLILALVIPAPLAHAGSVVFPGGGTGNMKTDDYDADDNGSVDFAEALDTDGDGVALVNRNGDTFIIKASENVPHDFIVSSSGEVILSRWPLCIDSDHDDNTMEESESGCIAHDPATDAVYFDTNRDGVMDPGEHIHSVDTTGAADSAMGHFDATTGRIEFYGSGNDPTISSTGAITVPTQADGDNKVLIPSNGAVEIGEPALGEVAYASGTDDRPCARFNGDGGCVDPTKTLQCQSRLMTSAVPAASMMLCTTGEIANPSDQQDVECRMFWPAGSAIASIDVGMSNGAGLTAPDDQFDLQLYEDDTAHSTTPTAVTNAVVEINDTHSKGDTISTNLRSSPVALTESWTELLVENVTDDGGDFSNFSLHARICAYVPMEQSP